MLQITNLYMCFLPFSFFFIGKYKDSHDCEQSWCKNAYFFDDQSLKIQTPNIYQQIAHQTNFSKRDIDSNYCLSGPTLSSHHLVPPSQSPPTNSRLSTRSFPFEYLFSKSVNSSPNPSENARPIRYDIFAKQTQQEKTLDRKEPIEYKKEDKTRFFFESSLPLPVPVRPLSIEDRLKINQNYSLQHFTHLWRNPDQNNSLSNALELSETNLKSLPYNKQQHKTIYQCSYAGCQKTFYKQSILRSHERMHAGIKPYECTWAGCGWKFGRSDELKRHFRYIELQLCKLDNFT